MTAQRQKNLHGRAGLLRKISRLFWVITLTKKDPRTKVEGSKLDLKSIAA
jgi:hypothetical protein